MILGDSIIENNIRHAVDGFKVPKGGAKKMNQPPVSARQEKTR